LATAAPEQDYDTVNLAIEMIVEPKKKSFDPRKTQKARKYSKRYQVVYCHPKGE